MIPAIAAWIAQQPNGGRILPENLTAEDVARIMAEIEARMAERAKR